MPTSGPPGTSVAFSGANLREILSIQFNGVAAVFQDWNGVFPPVAIVPQEATSGPITVSTAQGSFTTRDDFIVAKRRLPILTGFTPESAVPGAVVDLIGTDLSPLLSVDFNGTPAEFGDFGGVGLPHPYAVVPVGASSGPITVTTSEGSATSPTAFTVITPPVLGSPEIFDFSPTSGTSGTYVTLNGTNFAGVKFLYFNNTLATFFLAPLPGPPRSGSAVVPIDATSGPITIVTETGSFTTRENFTVTPQPPPAITGFSPLSGPPGTYITIEGSNLVFVSEVRFNGIKVDFHPFSLPLQIRVPYAASGPISVLTQSGAALSPVPFTVINGPPEPRLLSFFPTRGSSGTWVRLQGARLGIVTGVSFGPASAAFLSQGLEDVLAVVPPGAESGPITVQTSVGAAVTPTPFTAFNSVGLVVGGDISSNLVYWGKEITVRTVVTNASRETLYQVSLTNVFASALLAPPEPVIQDRNGVSFHASLAAADFEVLKVVSPGPAFTVTNNTVRFDLGTMNPGQSAALSIRLRPQTPGLFYSLASASGIPPSAPRRFASWLSTCSVVGPGQLTIARMDASRFRLSWASLDPAPVLQTATTSFPGLEWTNLETIITGGDGIHEAVLPIEPGDRFYRLAQPPP